MVGKFISFITFPIIAAFLSPKDFGILDLIMTITSLVGIFIGCGLNNAIVRFYWDKDVLQEQRPTIVSSAAAMQVCFSIALCCLIFSSWPLMQDLTINGEFSVTFSLLCAILLITCAAQWVQYIQDVTRLHFSPVKFLVLALVLRLFGAASALLIVVHYNGGVEGYIISQAIVITLAVPLGIWMIRKDLTNRLSFQWMRDLFHFGFPFVFSALAYWLFGSMDRWMLASMSSVEETGIYSVAFRFSTIVLFVSMAFGQAWSPHAIKIQADYPDTYRRIFANVLMILIFFMLIVAGSLALFAGEILYLIMPQEYWGAALPLAILCFAIVLQSTQQVTAVGISLAKRTYIFANLAWIAAIINFIGNYLFIPSYGASGAAFSTLISYLVLTGSYLFFTQRLHPLDITWLRLGGLMSLGCIVAVLSIVYVHVELDSELMFKKFIIAVLCLVLGALILPWKEIRHVKT